jgi:hypothetical protein
MKERIIKIRVSVKETDNKWQNVSMNMGIQRNTKM